MGFLYGSMRVLCPWTADRIGGRFAGSDSP